MGGGVENVCTSGIHVSAFPEALWGGGQGVLTGWKPRRGQEVWTAHSSGGEWCGGS